MQRKHSHKIYLTSRRWSHYQVIHFVIIFFLLMILKKIWNYWYLGITEILGLFRFHCGWFPTRKLRSREWKWPLSALSLRSGRTRSWAIFYLAGLAVLAGGTSPFVRASSCMFLIESPLVLINTLLVLSSDNGHFIPERYVGPAMAREKYVSRSQYVTFQVSNGNFFSLGF